MDEGCILEPYLDAAIKANLAIKLSTQVKSRLNREDSISIVQPTPAGLLSKRELETLSFLSTGLSRKIISQKLNLSPATVKTHLRNIYSKLNVSNKTQAINQARMLGWLD